MQTKYARNGFKEPYPCEKEWPDNCFVQCGEGGVVLCGENSYRTDFFEAFPKEPSTFIRGEGKSIQEAEVDAWAKYQRILACDGHEFRRKGTTNGVCVKCNLFQSNILAPIQCCSVCGLEQVDNSIAGDDGKEATFYCCQHYVDAVGEQKEPKKHSFVHDIWSFNRKYVRFINAYLKIKGIEGGDWQVRIAFDAIYDIKRNIENVLDDAVLRNVFNRDKIRIFSLIGIKEETPVPDNVAMNLIDLAIKKQSNPSMEITMENGKDYVEWIKPIIVNVLEEDKP